MEENQEIKIELNLQSFLEIIKKGYSLDLIFILKSSELSDINEIDSEKVNNIIKTAKRKGLLSDENKVTVEGKSLLDFLSVKGENVKLVKKKPDIDNFQLFWSRFPSTDTFEYKGRKFTGTRALKTKKDDCKAKLNKILNEGEYTIEDMIGALELEVSQKKEASYKTNSNKLSYFQNSLTYLDQRGFEGFIELFRAGHKKEDETLIKNIDI